MERINFIRIAGTACLMPFCTNPLKSAFMPNEKEEMRTELRKETVELVVLTADLKAWEKDPIRYWRNAPQPVKDYILPAMAQFYTGREQMQRDEGMRSCGMAAMTLMLAAQGMGYQSCPMDGFDFDEVARIINLPGDHAIVMFVVIGKGISDPLPRPGSLSQEDVVVIDQFS